MIDIEGRLSKFSTSLLGEDHIGARKLLEIQLIWFGFIARLSPWGGGILLVQMLGPTHRGIC
jgi:hypothetical protein